MFGFRKKNPQNINVESIPVQPAVRFTKELVSFKAAVNNMPSRGVMWYFIFTIFFLVVSGIVIYLRDWALLFFIVVAAGITVWRSHNGEPVMIQIFNEGITVGRRKLSMQKLVSFNFKEVGDEMAITFHNTEKIYPTISLVILEPKKIETIRKALTDKVPETEVTGESFVEFAIRVLKL